MVTKTTTIKIDEDVWFKFKLYCLNNKKTVSEGLKDIIEQQLKQVVIQ